MVYWFESYLGYLNFSGVYKRHFALERAKWSSHVAGQFKQFALVTRRPYCPGRPKKLSFTTPSLTPMVSTARLGVEKQRFFGLPGQYGRRVTRANCLNCPATCEDHFALSSC